MHCFLRNVISFFTPHAQREWGEVIGIGVHMCIIMFVNKKMDHILEIDSPFQTFVVGLLIKFID